MSLFPQGASSGMQGFMGQDPQKDQEKKEENIQPEVQPEPVVQELAPEPAQEVPVQVVEEVTEPIASAETLEDSGVKMSPLQKKLLEKKQQAQAAPPVQVAETPEVVQELVEEKVEEAPVQRTEPQIVEPKEVVVSQEPKREEVVISADEDFPTSVKIRGLTVDEEYEFEANFSQSEASFSSEDGSGMDSENLSDTERAELEDMSELYFDHIDPSQAPFGGVCLDELLDLAIDKDASDIHFSAGSKIALRINGQMFFVDNLGDLTREQARSLVFSLVPNPLHRRRLFEEKELDAAFEHKNGVNFRVNIFFKRGKISAVLRIIASHAMTMDQLGLPEALRDLLSKKQGLLLVTGPTGSGKSTSMQAMLEHINESRVEHILTIEDPIEYIFQNKKSVFSQREVGRDTHSFENALRASLREDPDIVMIGEMRDAETIQAAMQLAETGHLVISTLHTSSAPQTVARLVSHFPSDEQEQVQSRLADSLIGVLSQRLVKRTDRDGRVGLFELMIVNSAIRNIIRTGDMTQIHNAMMSGRDAGMVLMSDYSQNLADQGVISEDSFKNFFREE